MKTISIRQLASIKRTAQNVEPMVAKKNKIAAKIRELGKEFNDINVQIEGWEGAVISMTGHKSEELVTRVVTTATNEDGSVKLSSNGQPVKTTKYEPTDMLTFDEEKKVYIINEPVENNGVESTNSAEAPETTEDTDLFNI